jgi:hypothetical protein
MLQPKRPGEILRAALGLHQQRLLTLIAIAAVLVVPGGILNWQQSCSNGACQITVFDGEVAPFEGYVAFSLTAARALAILLEHEQPKRGGGFA